MSSAPTLIVATWSDGLFVVGPDRVDRELPGAEVVALAADGAGGVLAIVAGSSLRRRAPDGGWVELVAGASGLSACAALGETVFAGTNDAKVLRLDPGGRLTPLPGFETVRGRETWYAGNTIIDGRVVGPPLGVRSMCATCDGSTLLVNVHVGGVPRSTDSGQTWEPTLEVESDAHQVVAHAHRAECVAAATAEGLALSRDGGRTWKFEREGLHATHCLAAAFVGDEVWVSAATSPFSDGAVYRRSLEGDGSLQRLSGSALPEWFEGGVDTGNIAARGDVVAVADRAGHLFVSRDRGTTWELRATLPAPSGVLIV